MITQVDIEINNKHTLSRKPKHSNHWALTAYARGDSKSMKKKFGCKIENREEINHNIHELPTMHHSSKTDMLK